MWYTKAYIAISHFESQQGKWEWREASI